MFTSKNALVVLFAFASQFTVSNLVYGQAQDWGSISPEKFAAGELSRVGGMLKGKENVDPVLIKRYVNNEFARLTNAADPASFATVRTTMITAIRSGASEPAKKAAAEQVVFYAKGIATSPKYHPHSRINALVALTELDTNSNMPFAGTISPLRAIANDPVQPLHLRSIAVYGLNRHARLTKLPPAGVDLLAKEMTAIVSSQPRSSIDTKAHAWLVRRAFDVLTTLSAPHAQEPALARLLNDKELPSIRLAAADYLPRIDNSKLTDEKKTQYFIGLAQLLEQQLVMWYEKEEDTLNMKSGAMAGGMGGMGMGGMGDMGGMGMGGEGGMGMGMGGEGGMGMGMGGEGGMGMGMGGMGMGGEGGMGMGGMGGMGMGGMGMGQKPKASETQPWEVRLTRRHINQILQTAHVALDGKQIKGGRPVTANVKGLIDLGLPAPIAEPASDLLKSVESLQNRVNDSFKITTMNSLLMQTKKQIENIMDLVREVPALTAQYPKYQEKDVLNDVIEPAQGDAPAGGNANDPAAPAAGEGGEPATDPAAGGAPAGAAGAGNPAGNSAAGNNAAGN